ncbi:MAG: hypothetical protein R3B09_21415 [Nannocystaceae bacterium]
MPSRRRTSSPWVLSLCSLFVAVVASGCAHRRAAQPTETIVETTVEIPGQAVYVADPATQAGVVAVAEAPPAPATYQAMVPYDDQSYIEETYALDPVADNPDLLGYETTSTGQQLEVYVYVINVVQPIETYPRVWWSGRWYYNIDGYLVFYSPTFTRWCYYYGPPVGLAYAWNSYYPAQPYRWSTGYYGSGWYWGGTNRQGTHAYSRNTYPGGPAHRPASQGGPASRPANPGGPAHRPTTPGGPGRPTTPPAHASSFAPGHSKPPVTPASHAPGRVGRVAPKAAPLPRPGASGTITTSTGRTYPTPGAHGGRPTVSNRVVPPTRPSRPAPSAFAPTPSGPSRPHANGGTRVTSQPSGPSRPAPQSRPMVSRPSTPTNHRPMVSRPATPSHHPSPSRAPSSHARPSAPSRAPSPAVHHSSPSRAPASHSRPSAPRPSASSRSSGGGRRGR